MVTQKNRQNSLESNTGEHVIFPELLLNGLVHMWLKWRRSSIKSKQLGHCKDQLCWHLKSITALWISVCKIGVPPSGSWMDHRGSVIFSVLERKWEQLLTACICHYEVELPGSYGCLMIGEDEASSYNAMSVCECTFEYSGVGVQSDAYIWVQIYCIAALPSRLKVVWQIWVTLRCGETVCPQWILWLVCPLAALRGMRWIWCKHAPDRYSTDHLKWQTQRCMIDKWGQHGWYSWMLIVFAWDLLRARVEVFIRFGSMSIPTRCQSIDAHGISDNVLGFSLDVIWDE
jgi:hypothetical protein